jgi:hypothetical protein
LKSVRQAILALVKNGFPYDAVLAMGWAEINTYFELLTPPAKAGGQRLVSRRRHGP